MSPIVDTLQDLSPFLSAAAGLLAGILASITVWRAMRFSFSVKDLERFLLEAETRFEANLSDTTDRELRKILIVVHSRNHNRDVNRLIADDKLEKYLSTDRDFVVFIDAFSRLEGDEREVFCDRMSQNAIPKSAEILRRILVRSHASAI